MRATVAFKGGRELDRALGQLPAATGKNALRRAGRYGLEPTDRSWRQKAPRLSGTLAESGSVGSKLTRSQRKAQERESSVEVFAGPGPNPQAIQQEFGNEIHGPQPFLRPAWDETQDAIPDRVGESLWTEIQKAATRLSRKAAKAKG